MPKFTVFQVLNEMRFQPKSPVDARIVCTICAATCEFGREIISGRWSVCARCAIRLQQRALEATGQALPRYVPMPYGTAATEALSASDDSVASSMALDRKIAACLDVPPAPRPASAKQPDQAAPASDLLSEAPNAL